ncbi:hypothetical protein HRI_001836200 [Hibiscus trionum]|uniref:Glycine-rich protein n=1 Tax=Hibiscus trionum TaxID=183268 RepID=A0A9W7HQD3_HIBTR|nr:hypothetical protein HRI_001836200 [Hibiscus trionum]
MCFKHPRFPPTLFFLLLSLHLHLLPTLPMVAAGKAMEAKPFSISTEPGGKHEIEVVEKHGDGAAAGAHGGGGGDAAAGAASGGGGDNGRGSGAQIPVYTAGAMNHNRDHRHHGSNSGTINRVGSSCLALVLSSSIPLLIV